MEIVTFEDLKALLDLEKAAMSDYPALELIAELVQPSFEQYLGVQFDEERRSFSKYIENPTKLIPLEGLPVKSISTLQFEGMDITGYTIVEFGLRLGAEISNGLLECTYTGGLQEVPSWLRRAATLQVAYEYQTKEHIGSDYVTTEGGSVGRPALKMLNDVKRILDPHRHPLTRLF